MDSKLTSYLSGSYINCILEFVIQDELNAKCNEMNLVRHLKSEESTTLRRFVARAEFLLVLGSTHANSSV